MQNWSDLHTPNELVGNTPLVQLIGLTSNPKVKVFAKLEYYNLTGSVKSRAAANILRVAAERGDIQRGSVILDASSGNTGIAYAALSAIHGYQLKLCLPTNANEERKSMLKAYGVDCIYTSPLEGSDGAIREARRLAVENPDWFYCDQYSNDANWKAHFMGTGPEIWYQTGGEVTHFFSSLGTSGTFVGTSKYLQQVSNGTIQCFAVQPDSPFHGLEGMKHMESAMVPPIYQPDLATEHLEASTEESFELIGKVARTQGLLIGPSCAAALLSAIEYSDRVEEGCFVVVFPDSGERYLSDKHIWEQGAGDAHE